MAKTDSGLLISAIEKVTNNNLPGRNDPCFCGSNLKFKRCHHSAIEYLIPVSKGLLLQDQRTLEKFQNEEMTRAGKE